MLANSYQYELDVLPVEVGNAFYTSSMELNLDLQRSLTTCFSTMTFSYFFRLLQLSVSEEMFVMFMGPCIIFIVE